MIAELICYKCTCSKCKGSWITKDHTLPKNCSKCRSIKWNDDAPEMTSPVIAPVAVQTITPTNKVEQLPAPVDDNWIELPATRQDGDLLYWHRKPKGSPVNYKRERDWDNFA